MGIKRKIPLKPLSVNEAWQGKRFKTPKYKKYESDLLFILPKIKIPDPPYQLYFKFGFSSTLSDGDNPVKPTQDILAKKYGFDDKLIKRWVIETEIVKKGAEFIEFELTTITV